MARKIEKDSVSRSDGCLEQVEFMPELFAVAVMDVENLHAVRLEHTPDCFSVWHRMFQTFFMFVVADADNESK